ncbi:MAG TPA: hypothetical protein PJ982_20430, partial [Lacipirellulaceae bacterium]|nr:hypothetical protein [Lacipirellulaceae bacterium]
MSPQPTHLEEKKMNANTTRNRNHARLTAAVMAALVSTNALAQSTWTGATGGEWGDAANWTGGVPNAVDAVANINTALTVNLSDTGTAGTYPYTVGTLASNIATGSVVL